MQNKIPFFPQEVLSLCLCYRVCLEIEKLNCDPVFLAAKNDSVTRLSH